MFILTGPGCSGKDTIAELIETDIRFKDYERLRTYTSRPMRAKEKEGEPYFFRDDNFFKEHQKEFVIHSSYKSFLSEKEVQYGLLADQFKENSFLVGLTPFEVFQLVRYFQNNNIDINPIVIYIIAPRNNLMIRALVQGRDLDESYRRIISDYGTFNGFEKIADITVNNNDRDLKSVVTELYIEIEKILLERKEAKEKEGNSSKKKHNPKKKRGWKEKLMKIMFSP